MKRDLTIHIAMGADGRYAIPLSVAMASLARSASREYSLVFHCMMWNISKDLQGRIVEIVSCQHPHVCVEWIELQESMFEGMPEWNHSRMAYSRLMLPELLPQLDHLIYSDCDVLWFRDVAECWECRDDDVAIQAGRDTYDGSYLFDATYIKRKDSCEIPRDSYVCTGVMLMNLKLLRRQQFTERSFSYLRVHPDAAMVDQTVINSCYSGKIKVLPDVWQTSSRFLTPCSQDGFQVVVHLANYFPLSKWCTGEIIDDMQYLWVRIACKLWHKNLATEMTTLFGANWRRRRVEFKLMTNSGLRLSLMVLAILRRLLVRRVGMRKAFSFYKRNYVRIGKKIADTIVNQYTVPVATNANKIAVKVVESN